MKGEREGWGGRVDELEPAGGCMLLKEKELCPKEWTRFSHNNNKERHSERGIEVYFLLPLLAEGRWCRGRGSGR